MSTIDTSVAWTILRLAWKLSRRRWERQSPMLGGVAILMTVIGIGSAVAAFALALFLGVAFLPGTGDFALLILWDVVVGVFLMLWVTGLLVQLQLGGESLVLEKLLHMPVSPLSAFLMNFAGSQLRVSLLVSLGAMLGLGIASVATLGVGYLILFPLVLAFAAMVMCVTHQFQSWLARMFTNKRRRGTVVAIAVLVFVLLVNLPALINQLFDGRDFGTWDSARIEQWAIIANAALPPGWLALGVWGTSSGQAWLGVLGVVGMLAIAALSLRRSYRKTLAATVLARRPQTDKWKTGRRHPRVDSSDNVVRRSRKLAERNERSRGSGSKDEATEMRPGATTFGRTARVPSLLVGLFGVLLRHVPEHSRAVAWVALRLWIRGPQGKMVLLSPVLLIMLYIMLFRTAVSGEWAAHFAVLGMMGFMIMMAFNLFANLFGQDGNGFRAVVLAGVGARELLLGKNLALLPYVLILGTVIIALLQWLHALPASHVVANFLQLFVLYLVGCMLGNSFSIRVPWPMSPTSMGMRNATAATFLASFLILILLLAVILPLAIPIWIDKRMAQDGSAISVYLTFSLVELPVIWFIYRRSLVSKGRLLNERMETVLERVTQPIE